MCGGKKENKKDCCITIDDEGQCFGIVLCKRQCGCFPCHVCVPDDDGHRCAVIMFCCQLNVLWPCEFIYGCACGKPKAAGGAPVVEITDAVEAPQEISRE